MKVLLERANKKIGNKLTPDYYSLDGTKICRFQATTYEGTSPKAPVKREKLTENNLSLSAIYVHRNP